MWPIGRPHNKYVAVVVAADICRAQTRNAADVLCHSLTSVSLTRSSLDVFH